MYANSRQIQTAQTGIHDDLARRVERALAGRWQRPIAGHNREAFHRVLTFCRCHGGEVIFDTGCGTGLSTRRLAERFPAACVIGIDRSAERLSRREGGALPDNALMVRADLVDFWRLALAHALRPVRQYLFYPNPWPKASQLKRRWHAHPVFPTLLALGGRLELRSNWRLYVEEFAQALWQAVGLYAAPVPVRPVREGDFISAFERKYHHSGHPLWGLSCRLEGAQWVRLAARFEADAAELLRGPALPRSDGVAGAAAGD